VASAGNFGNTEFGTMTFSLLPGAWREVVSVGGLAGEDMSNRNPWINSNPGEIVAPAAWYQYITPNNQPTAGYYAGTSFAAPAVSVMGAVQLSAELVSCSFDTMPPYFAWH
jgi:subtilisin family serine protease